MSTPIIYKEMTTSERNAAVREAVASFPPEFGLRAYPGEVFRVSPTASYWSDFEGGVLVYTQVRGRPLFAQDAPPEWMDFAKGTPAELRRQLVRL